MSTASTATMRDGFVDVDGARLEYRHIGPAPETAPTIVMLHEGLGAITMWRDFPDQLAEATGFGVFVYARQGYGKSSPCALPRPLDYMTREAVDVVPKLLDVIGFRRGVLLGHSDGGSIAAIYAGHHEDPRLAGTVLMAPHFFTEDFGIASIAEARKAYDTTDLRGKLMRHHFDNVDCAFEGWAGAWLDPKFREWDITEFLPPTRTPTLVVQGKDDQYGTVAQVDAVVEMSGGPVETALLDDCGHSPFRDQPDAALDVSAAFIKRLLS